MRDFQFEVNAALHNVRHAALNSIVANDYADPSDPHADASAEHADEGLALAARELVIATQALAEGERPIGWVSTFGAEPSPQGLDARPLLMYTAHCSHCGKVAPNYEGEGNCLWTAADLPKLGQFHLGECDWKINDGLTDPDFEGRALVCSECWSTGWCETCDSEVHAWQPVVDGPGAGVIWHKACGAPGAAELAAVSA